MPPVWKMKISSCIAQRVEPIATYVECNLHNDIKYASRVLKTLKLFCRSREAKFQSFSGKISPDYLVITLYFPANYPRLHPRNLIL